MNPYKVTDKVMDELHSRCHQKLESCYPGKLPEKISKRLKREDTILASTPYTYALLIADEVIKKLRYHRFSASLEGDWFCCYYAWLLDLTKDDPIWVAKFYQSLGWRAKQLVRDKCIESPIEIAVSPGWAKTACLELLRLHAQDWGFWLWQCPNGDWKLISLGYRPDDLYAACAPVVRIVDGD